jgi:hypothetical protein
MSFQDAINRILHIVNDGNGNPKYVPYVTGSGSIPNINDAVETRGTGNTGDAPKILSY